MLGGTAIEIGNAYLRFTMAGKLLELRLAHGKSQQEVADFIGVTVKEYADIENGFERINVEVLMRALQYYDMKMVKFFSDLQLEYLPKETVSQTH